MTLHSSRRILFLLALPVLLAVCPGCDRAQAEPEEVAESVRAEPPRVQPVPPGAKFPAGKYALLNPGSAGPEQVDLAALMGVRPVVLYYWIAGHERSEKILLQVEKLAADLADEGIAFYTVVVERPERSIEAIRERIAELGIRLPVINDEGFRIGQQVQVVAVPHVSVIDGQGRLQLTNGGSLQHAVEYKLDVEGVIRRAAVGEPVVTYGVLDHYYPVKELEGERCPDFKAPLLADSVEQRWYSVLDQQKLNVLIFWSVDCPHCRESLPQINDWLKANPGGANIWTAANVNSEEVRAKTLDFAEVNDFRFPTLVDEHARIGNLFQITSTPTVLFIGPDGVIDSAITTAGTDFGQAIQQKRQELLQAVGS